MRANTSYPLLGVCPAPAPPLNPTGPPRSLPPSHSHLNPTPQSHPTPPHPRSPKPTPPNPPPPPPQTHPAARLIRIASTRFLAPTFRVAEAM